MVEKNDRALRARSTKSVCVDQLEEDSLLLTSLLTVRPDKPCHKIQDSLFSSSGYVDYSGILNFAMILLILSSANIALESIKQYGNLYDPIGMLKLIFYNPMETPYNLILFLGIHTFALSSLGIEVLLSKGLLSEIAGQTIITTLLTSEFVIPATILYFTDSHLVVAGIIAFFALVLGMKQVSYHITNSWCRGTHVRTPKVHKPSVSEGNGNDKDTGNGNVQKNLIQYPDNLNLKDFYYFLGAPTLCYELNFPRSDHIRKGFLFKRLLEIVILTQLNSFLVLQCILPTYNETVKPLQEMDYLRIIEQYFKVVVPYIGAFITAFYAFYHSFLNALAEILRFGDRYFYCDFWNSGKIMDFWQKWSIPIHKFSLRHIYLPLRKRGFTHYQTLTIFFFLSAAFHEYVFDVSLKMFTTWSFVLLLTQVPYFMFLDKFLDEKFGNIVAFLFFIIALPFYNLVYYYDYYMKNYHNVEAAV